MTLWILHFLPPVHFHVHLFARICRLSARLLAPSARGGRAAGLLRGGPGLQLRRGLPRAIPMRALRRSTLRLGARAGARCSACGSRCKSSRLRAACAGGAAEEAPLGVRFSPGGARGAFRGGRHTREANAPARAQKSEAEPHRRGVAQLRGFKQRVTTLPRGDCAWGSIARRQGCLFQGSTDTRSLPPLCVMT